MTLVTETTDLLDELQSEFGYATRIDKFDDRRVKQTKELERIRDLPRRDWRQDPSLPRLAYLLTRKYRYNDVKCSTKCEGCKAQSLNKAQTTFLRDLHDLGDGLFAPLAVGSGKTLACFLAPAVAGARNPLLLVPANQLEKTKKAYAQYRRHWRLPDLTVWSYEYLGHPKQLNALAELNPDLILCDESHTLRDPGTKAAKRISRYVRVVNLNCRACFLTGSAAGRSIMEYWHYLRWALKSRAPVPASPIEARGWALALDEKVPDELRFEPGALFQLSPGARTAREAYMLRLTSTPGVVSTLEDIPPCGLVVSTKRLPLPAQFTTLLQGVRDGWATPDGQSFRLALEMWAHMRTLVGSGLYMRWTPDAPRAWREARNDYYGWCRERLRYAKLIDSIVHLEAEIDAGKWPEGAALRRAWLEIEPTFTPNSQAYFVDDTVHNYCANWLETEKGLCWVEQRELGERLSRSTGIPFFAEQGLDQKGRLIDDWDGPAIVSLNSCTEGHNMQDYHHKNLVTNWPTVGRTSEQMIGRTHRNGQKEHEVHVECLITAPESVTYLKQAMRDSVFMAETSGQPVRLLYANKAFQDEIEQELEGLV